MATLILSFAPQTRVAAKAVAAPMKILRVVLECVFSDIDDEDPLGAGYCINASET